jgi:diaminopimelate epimerase
MRLRFTKMHGIGNDYVYINCFDQEVERPAALALRLSDRHFGVGGDGLILIRPPLDAADHCRMEMYNADGSRAQMCGNGVRCVAKYVYDHGISRRDVLRVETDAGVKVLEVHRDTDGTCRSVTVDMGKPGLRRRDLPMVDGGDPDATALNVGLQLLGRTFHGTAVSMGNPHFVVRLDSAANGTDRLPPLSELPLSEWGPRFENHPWFPQRTNTEFISFRSRREMDFRVWERGSGETLACGTGACAAVVAGVLNDWCEREVCVHLRGGDLEVAWAPSGDGGSVSMTGEAAEVFSGEIEI